MKKLESLDSECSFGDFRSMRMRVAWLANTRPDMLFEYLSLRKSLRT